VQARSYFLERFSSSGFASLKDIDGFGQLPDAPGATAELPHEPPVLEPGMTPVGVFLRAGQLRMMPQIQAVVRSCTAPEAIGRPGIDGQADGFGGPDPLRDLRGLPEVQFGLVYAAYGPMAAAGASRRS
jgi:hypothetical protein